MKKNRPKHLKPIPRFKSEAEERRFWAKHDSSEYVAWDKAARNVAFPNLGPSVHTVS